MPKISIIIPIYNVEKYLRECLDSVVNQTIQDIEIICINDCSNDNSIQIVEEYAKKDNRIKVICHKKNRGVACSRNTGIDNAIGEYIFFLDPDDYLLKGILEELYQEAMKTKSDIIISKAKVFSDFAGEDISKRIAELNEYLSYEDRINYQITIDNFIDILDNYPDITCGILFKNKFIKDNDLKFIDKKVIHEDNGFFIKTLSLLPNATFSNLTSIMYRIRPNSITDISSKNPKFKDKNMKIVLDDAFEYIRKHHQKKYSELLVYDIKTSGKYYKYFGIYIKYIYIFVLGRKNKIIKFLGFPIFREKYIKNKQIIKILGIPIFTKTHKDT